MYFQHDLSNVTTLSGFLTALKLESLSQVFAAEGVTELQQLSPTLLEQLGLAAGIRQRMLRALASTTQPLVGEQLMRPTDSPGGSSSGGDGSPALPSGSQEGNPSAAPMDVVPTRTYRCPNSTSSLYIESTIAHPDTAQLCFCMSLVIHDLISDAEAARPQDFGSRERLALFAPRDIFTLPGKRNRADFEGEVTQPEPAQLPSEEVCQRVPRKPTAAYQHASGAMCARVRARRRTSDRPSWTCTRARASRPAASSSG